MAIICRLRVKNIMTIQTLKTLQSHTQIQDSHHKNYGATNEATKNTIVIFNCMAFKTTWNGETQAHVDLEKPFH